MTLQFEVMPAKVEARRDSRREGHRLPVICGRKQFPMAIGAHLQDITAWVQSIPVFENIGGVDAGHQGSRSITREPYGGRDGGVLPINIAGDRERIREWSPGNRLSRQNLLQT